VGISTFEKKEKPLESLIERAERALYHSKALGRDRVSVIMCDN
jgi:PleD family two-component response regulator